jgi:hypothetical protein
LHIPPQTGHNQEGEEKNAEKEMGIKIPKELIQFYQEIGCGFIGSKKDNVNRIMDPMSICDFRLKRDDYEFYPDIELYDEFADKLVFFEQSMEALISIEITNKERAQIYYYDTVIANSLEEFLKRIIENELYYLEMI